MDALGKAIELATAEFKKEYGPDAKLKEGDEFATVFNDCILILGMEDHALKVKFLFGKPYFIDFDLDMTESVQK